MQARFIGKDGSLGYHHGQIYDLAVRHPRWWDRWPGGPTIVRPFPCPYASWEAFYANWTPVAWELDNTPAVE